MRAEHPGADFLIHPECGCSTSVMEYVAAGDLDSDGVHMLSTGGMLELRARARAPRRRRRSSRRRPACCIRCAWRRPTSTSSPPTRRLLPLHEDDHAAEAARHPARRHGRGQGARGARRARAHPDRADGRDRLAGVTAPNTFAGERAGPRGRADRRGVAGRAARRAATRGGPQRGRRAPSPGTSAAGRRSPSCATPSRPCSPASTPRRGRRRDRARRLPPGEPHPGTAPGPRYLAPGSAGRRRDCSPRVGAAQLARRAAGCGGARARRRGRLRPGRGVPAACVRRRASARPIGS